MPTVAELEKRIDRQDERIEVLEGAQSGMNEKMIRLDEKMNSFNNELKHLSDQVAEIKADVKTLVLKPGKRYENLSLGAIASLITGVLGFLIAHMFQ